MRANQANEDKRGISSNSVVALRCPAGKDRQFLWDDKLPGFGVAAFASGKKVYVFQYRHEGISKRLTLGKHGAITPERARKLAKVKAGLVASGKDPMGERKAERGIRTFKELSDDYLRLHVRTRCKPRTAQEYDWLLRLHVSPAIGSKRVSDVRRGDISRLHDSLADSPATANRAVTLVATIWNWAKDRDEFGVGDNPAARIQHYPEKGRERFLTADEVGRLGDALRLAETQGIPWTIDETNANAKHAANKKSKRTKIDPHAAGAIRLLILTGARLREILHAKWEYLDWERGVLRLPDSKTGRKTIYLSAPALAVLQGVPRVEGNPYIIAGHGSRKSKSGKTTERNTARTDLKNPWAAVVRSAGLVEHVPATDDGGKPILDARGKPVTEERPTVRIHDLRHSFASVGAGASLGLPIIGKLLGHSQPATTARYSHLDADPMRRAADIIGNQIAAAMEGKRAEVVQLHAKK
jgi:integrase